MLEGSLYIIDRLIKGIIIGIVVSAPMGPVGVLIVQRTLNKGRWFGFATGVGAAVSDLVYAMVCCLCMSLVLPFLEGHKVGLQTIGSVLLFAFGIYTYRSRPNTKLPHKSNGKKQKGTLVQNAVTGFLLTFSNPIIVFLFLMLYAHFSFVTDNYFQLGVEFVGVTMGALGWWLGLTYLISKVRKKFNEERIWRLNKTIGIIVMVVSLMSLYFAITGRTLY